MIFTSANSVRTLLPSNSSPRALNQGTILNASNHAYDNGLAAQVLTTMLNIGFGKNADFQSSDLSLADLFITSGIFKGMKVSELLTIANTSLGSGSTKYSMNDINEALIAVNGNYEEGFDFVYLSCTGGSSVGGSVTTAIRSDCL